MTILVSVVLPCFNSAEMLPAVLESIREQSFQDFELIVIDDASTDHSVYVLKKELRLFENSTLVELKKNVGPGAARNIGVGQSKANLVAFIDADDLWKPRKLEVQTSLHCSAGIAFSCTGFEMGNGLVTAEKVNYISLLKNNVINTSSVMYDRSKICVHFQSQYKSEDYSAWLAVVKLVEIHFIDDILLQRSVFAGLSANKFEMAYRRWCIYRKQEQFGILKSSYFFFHYVWHGLLKYLRVVL